MPTYTAKAFNWTENRYNAQYDKSYSITITDNDDYHQGSSDSDERVSIDGGPDVPTTGPAYVIKVRFKDVDGNSHIESFNFFKAAGDWYFIPSEDSQFTEGAYLGYYVSHTVGWEYGDSVCFVTGTKILTNTGPRLVEQLNIGDLIWTKDHGHQPLRQILKRSIDPLTLRKNPKLAPICIEQNALGQGVAG